MASACVNNNVGLLPEKNFFNGSYDWFNPRDSKIEPSFSPTKLSENLIDLDFSGKDNVNVGGGGAGDDSLDFEFRLEDPVNMLPADELFFDGKLMPLHVSTNRLSNVNSSSSSSCASSSRSSSSSEEIRSASVEEILKSKVSSISSGMDPYLFSPKAPRCSSGWRELLGLKKLQQNSSSSTKTPSKSVNPSSLKNFIHRNPKSDHSLALPLLKETDSPVSISSLIDSDVIRDLPRVSLDSHKSSYHPNSVSIKRNHHAPPPKVRLARKLSDPNSNTTNNTTTTTNMSTMSSGSSSSSSSSNALGVTMDSPRMNSSGKVVFQSLERSSSSPSTFNGGPRVKYKGMERRSYSANVKVSPVLNVPVCSLRGSSKFGLGQLFPSPHKKSGGTSSSSIDFSSEKARSSHVNKQKPSS